MTALDPTPVSQTLCSYEGFLEEAVPKAMAQGGGGQGSSCHGPGATESLVRTEGLGPPLSAGAGEAAGVACYL